MKIFHLHREQRLRRPLAEVFAFFVQPRNLESITPVFTRVRVVATTTDDMCAGTEIDYRLRLHGIPIRWRSRITLCDPPHSFTDEQIRGPYRLWRHEHRFRAEDGQTVVTDHVEYAVPGGAWIERLFVRRDLERIFDYRHARVAQIFAPPTEPSAGQEERVKR